MPKNMVSIRPDDTKIQTYAKLLDTYYTHC